MSTPMAAYSFWQKVRDLPRNIWVLTLASFLTDVSTEMIVHLIPLFLANVLGVRTVTIGLIEGVAETTASLLKVWSGRFSDWLGRRKWLTVSGYALSTVAKPFLVLANSWPAVLGVRFFERMGKGIRTAPRDALVADSITPEKRGMAFGLHRAGNVGAAHCANGRLAVARSGTDSLAQHISHAGLAQCDSGRISGRSPERRHSRN